MQLVYDTQFFWKKLHYLLHFLVYLKSTGTVLNLSTSILSISAFKLTKFDFSANSEVSVPASFFKSAFVA